jgi:tetratricopeptide (TPR) repeat protein
MVFERKHQEEPTDAVGYLDRGNRYSRNAVYDRAIDDYTTAISMDPELAEAFYSRGCSYYEIGRYDDSIADLTRAIEINPSADAYYGQRSVVHLFNDQPELAQEDQDQSDALRYRAQLEQD